MPPVLEAASDIDGCDLLIDEPALVVEKISRCIDDPAGNADVEDRHAAFVPVGAAVRLDTRDSRLAPQPPPFRETERRGDLNSRARPHTFRATGAADLRDNWCLVPPSAGVMNHRCQMRDLPVERNLEGVAHGLERNAHSRLARNRVSLIEVAELL